MTASDELRRIADSTSQLSDRKLVQVLDLAAIMPDQTQAQAIIERVRPRLAKIRPPRKAAIQRMFFNPVEDLFLSRDKNDQEKFCLTRYIIAPCWSLITQHCDPILLSTVADGLRDLYDHDHTKIITVMTPLWEAAHPILKSWLSERASAPMDSKGLRLARTEGKLRWQMAELAAILSVAREIEQAKMHLPCKPISRLSENDLGVIRATVTHLANAAPEKMPHFVRALAARMSRPGDMLKLLGDTELPLGSKETEAAVNLTAS